MASIDKRLKKNGEWSYRVAVRIKGFPETCATFTSEEEAIEWGKQTEETFRKRSKQFSPTLKIVLDRYLNETLPKKSKGQREDEKLHIKFWDEKLGEKYIDSIKVSEIEDTANEIYKMLSKRTGLPLTYESRRKYLMTLSYIYNTAVKEWRWADHNPVSLVNKHVPSKKKNTVNINLTDTRAITFYNKIEEVMKDRKISTHELARRVGCALSTAQHFLSRNNNITLQMMMKVATALELDFDIVYKD